MSTQPDLTIDKIEKYNLRVPRYTSYPTVPNWDDQVFGLEDYLNNLHQIQDKREPISLYVHIPFCVRRCLFCACNTIITQREERSVRYLQYLKKEIDTISDILSESREVIQLHLGGGTPTHFNKHQLDELFNYLHENFTFTNNSEKSIEVHPSVTTLEQISLLKDYNFNRLSMGVQDFDPEVQEKLNRHQSFEETEKLISYARDIGFESINTDLIYGLPYQSPKGFDHTIDQILDLRPERIALYSYAHFPQIFKHHKGIPLDVIPDGPSKLELFLKAREKFLSTDYEQVGFDHFSLTSDDLWRSYKDKTLRRNFMGYTTKSGTDLVAFGWSGISELSSAYAQNSKDMKEYESLVDKYGVGTVKGHQMTVNDKIRKELIMDILCQGEINIKKFENEFDLKGIKDDVRDNMPELEKSGFVIPKNNGWILSNEGQIFARVVASSFDEYFSNDHLFSTSV